MRALKSLADGSLTGKRNQELMSPPCVTDRIGGEWGGIALDASADRWRHVPAETHYVGEWGLDGLALPWMDRTYVNPEFKHLKRWLERARGQALAGYRIAMLVPVRPHRRWYREARQAADATVELDPLTFWIPHPETGDLAPFVSWSAPAGSWATSAYPAPLEIMAFNWSPTPAVWAEIGDVRCRCT